MRAGILAVLGAFALIAACADKSAEPAGDASPAASSDTAAMDAASSGDSNVQQETPLDGATAASGPLACVKDVPADAICTMDLNQCGHSGSCNCGPGYIYNASLGKCLLIMDGVSEAVKADLADDDCTKTAVGACTKDINVCGQPSACQCDEGFAWNAVAGKCVKGG